MSSRTFFFILLSTGLSYMDITLTVDGVVVPAAHALANTIAFELEANTPAQRAALVRLANHDDYEVRSTVAGKEDLPKECYLKLAGDPSVEVLSALLFNDSFHQYASIDIYKAIIGRDPKLQNEASANIQTLNPELQLSIGQWLISLGDYKTRWNMADSRSTPRSLLELLSADADKTIADAASSKLNPDDYEEENQFEDPDEEEDEDDEDDWEK
jgi:hypothetical protein